MLIASEKAQERLSSAGNLLNRIRAGVRDNSRSKAMGLFVNKAPVTEQAKPAFELPIFRNQREAAVSSNTAVVVTKEEVKIPEVVTEPENTPTIDHILNDADSKIKLETVAKEALSCLHSAVIQLKQEIPNMPASKLPDVAAKMSKVVSDIRDKQKDANDSPVHLHFYAPERKTLGDYQKVTV